MYHPPHPTTLCCQLPLVSIPHTLNMEFSACHDKRTFLSYTRFDELIKDINVSSSMVSILRRHSSFRRMLPLYGHQRTQSWSLRARARTARRASKGLRTVYLSLSNKHQLIQGYGTHDFETLSVNWLKSKWFL